MSEMNEYRQTENDNYYKQQLKSLDSDNVVDTPNINNLLREEFPQIIQNFYKMDIKEIEPTTQKINENVFEEDLSIMIDELVNLYFEERNKGKEENVRKQFVLDYFNIHKINLQEIY